VRESFLIIMASVAVLTGTLAGCSDNPNRVECYLGVVHAAWAPCAAGTHGADVQAEEQAKAQAAAQAQATADNAQQGNISSNVGSAMNPAIAAQRDFERSVADYKQCLADNPRNASACEGPRHIMDASARAAGHSSGSR
jgi:hypothetical protein